MEQQQNPLGQSVSNFAVGLLQNLSQQNQNLIISPASIYLALSMVALGAQNNTLKQFQNVLHFESQDQLANLISQGQQALMEKNERVQVSIANKIYQSLKIKEKYQNQLKDSFHSEIEQVNFQQNADQIGEQINQWVEQQTNSKIKDLIQKGSIEKETRMILVNAIYFKGDWKKKFNKIHTEKAPFTTQKGEVVQVDMMFQNKKHKYHQEDDFQFVSLPYAGLKYSMNIFLPNDIQSFEKKLTPAFMQECMQKAFKMKVDLHLPRFKFAPGQPLELKTVLQKLGLEDVFNDHSDLSLITEEERLGISSAVHKAMIEVNEEGAEAAAATGIKIVPMCLIISPDMNCNKPFIYTIQSNTSNTVLFIGKVNNPLVEA